MGKAAVVGAVAATAAVVGAVVVWTRRKAQAAPQAQPAAAAAVLPVQDRGAAGAGQVAPSVAAPAKVGAPPPSPSPLSGVLNTVAKQGAKQLLGASAATVQMGFQAAELQRRLVTKVAGEGLGNTAAVIPGVTAYALASKGLQTVGAKLGVPADISRRVAQTAAIAAVDPTGIVTSVKATAEVVSLGIRAIGGRKAEEKVRGVFRGLDPTNHRNVTHAPIKAAAAGVKAVSGFFGGLFGKKKKK